MFGLSTIGVLLYILFSISLISISIYVSHTKEVTLDSYFFANHNTNWIVLGISLITTCIFSPYIFGITSSGMEPGLILIYGIVSVIMAIVLGWFLVPLYFKIKISTLPEYFEKRFNLSCKYYLSAIYIFFNVLVRMVIILVAGNAIINIITGVDAFPSLLFFLTITGVYIIIGGLQSELYVNIIQSLFIFLGVISFLFWIISQSGESHSILYKFSPASYIGAAGKSEFSTAGLILGLPILGFWFWCADQFMVQKVLSVRDVNTARKSVLIPVFFQFIPILIFALPGILLNHLLQPGNMTGSFQSIFLNDIIPESLRGGLVLAAAAALMAAFASLFNSTSVLITFDFYRSLNPSSSDRKLVLVGRLTTMLLLICAILLIPIAQSISIEICIKLFKIFTYSAALVSAVFLTGLLNKRINSFSALYALIAGTILIVVRAISELFLSVESFTNDTLRWLLQGDFLEFSIFLFLVSVILLFVFNSLQQKNNSLAKDRRNIFIHFWITIKDRMVISLMLLIFFILVAWWILF